MLYDDAKEICETNDAQLVLPTNEEMNSHIVREVGYHIWLGIHCLDPSGSSDKDEWVDLDDDPLAWSNWYRSNPNNLDSALDGRYSYSLTKAVVLGHDNTDALYDSPPEKMHGKWIDAPGTYLNGSEYMLPVAVCQKSGK